MKPTRTSLALAAASFLAVVASCKDSSTGPAPRITVAMQATVTEGPVVELDDEGLTIVRCRVQLEAVATGTGTASWRDGRLLFYAGRNRTTALDDSPMPTETVASIWGGAEIEAGETREGIVGFTANFPFAVTLEMQYRAATGGAVQTAEASFTCGPTVEANSPPPSMTALTIEPASAQYEPGQVITVGFTAQSQIGFLSSELVISGACDHRVTSAHLLEKTVTGNLIIQLPETCRSDRPLVFTVTAEDAALEEATQTVSKTLTLNDVTPPTITPLFFPPYGSSAVEQLAGEYFVEDSVYLIFNANDNRRIAALIWEALPSGVIDSVVFLPGMSDWVKIPVRASWGTGPIQMRLYARDAAGLTSNVYTSAPNAVRVSPTIVRPTRTATVAGEIRDFVIDTRRGALYLLQSNQRRIAVLSLETMAVTRLIELPFYAPDVDITPQGDSLVVTLPQAGALGVIDLRDAAAPVSVVPLTILDATVEQAPHLLRFSTTGKALVALQGNATRAYALAEVDLPTNTQRFRTDAGDGGFVGGGKMERSHDASTIIIQGGRDLFQRYDATVDRFGPRHSAIPYDWRPSVDGMGLHVAIGLDVYGETLLPLRRVNSPNLGGVPPTALSASGEHLYVLTWIHGVVRYRVSDGVMLDRTVNPIQPNIVRSASGGAFIVTAEQNFGATSKLSVIDMR